MTPIEVETGPMFSGKTSELQTQIRRLIVADEIHGIDYLIFNHNSDTRYGNGILASHCEVKTDAILAQSSEDIFNAIFEIDNEGSVTLREGRNQLTSLFVDEVQFFDNNIGLVLDYIDRYYRENLSQNINIFCAGLDMDFRGEPFGPMPDLLARASKVNKFVAVCKKCEKGTPRNAQYTQRLVNGKPASYHEPIILVGAAESYTARCQKHYEIPDKPAPKFEK